MNRYIGNISLSLVETMKKIDKNGKGTLFIVDDRMILLGVISDGDIRRWIIETGDLNGNISKIMNKNPITQTSRDVLEAVECMKIHQIRAIPIVDEKKKVIDVILNIENDNLKVTKDKTILKDIPVVIMAGGKGTRLEPYTKILPKPLIPIDEIPIMERIINKFTEYGVRDFLATINYKGNMIKSYFSDVKKNYSIDYIEEIKPFGTAGSLKLINRKFEQPFFVSNCDILIHADYTDIYKRHMESGNELTVVVALKVVEVPYGVVYAKEDGQVVFLEEKPKHSYFVNTGLYILNGDLINDIPEEKFFHMTDLINTLLSQGRKVGMYPISEDSFLDMGEFEEMQRMEERLNMKTE